MEPSDGGAPATPALPAPRRRGPLERVLSTRVAQRALSLHEAHPRRAAATLFLAGVGWDAATIFRIDSVIDNALILLYLGALCVLYFAATLHDAGKLENPTLLRFVRWYPMASQFLMGALFSMFVFFYSQSASWSETSVFLLVLVALLVANEVLHDRMFSARLRLVLLYFVLASYLIYAVPIVTGVMNHLTFTVGLLLAAGIISLLGRMLWNRGLFRERSQMASIAVAIPLLVGFLEVAYTLNWIPPVPLAVRDAGVYHTVKRDGDVYRMRMAKPPWFRFWKQTEDPFRYSPGDTVYVYTAVFAPTRLQKGIVHVWEQHDGTEWVETDRIGYLVSGGRDHGYRGYTMKRLVEPGRWRVRVETEPGRLLTRVRFDIEPGEVNRWKWITDT